MNNPQKCPKGLYAEQLSGTSFTQPRHLNLRTWLYKIRPTVGHTKHTELKEKYPFFISDFSDDREFTTTPDQLRWKPLAFPPENSKVDFLQGVRTYCGVGSPSLKNGLSIHLYSCNSPMEKDSAFYSADGDLLIVPQQGALDIVTELGKLYVNPLEIVIMPRGIRFHVSVNGNSRGYMTEIYKSHFRAPDRGPIGSNGLANERDFQAPVAWSEDRSCQFKVLVKYQGKFFETSYDHSIFDTVSWHGNYYPMKYDLNLYNTMGTITYDHPDPSIFTVLTANSDEPNTALCDFVIFNPRWLVAEKTFRPPYYHRNTMTEFMGNVFGVYDAKEEGFVPGSASLHSCMTGHGPESAVFEKASNSELKPQKLEDTLSIMFETCFMLKMTKFSMCEENQDPNYIKCWENMKKHF